LPYRSLGKNPVAPLRLGLVERLIRFLQKPVNMDAQGIDRGDADRYGKTERLIIFQGKGCIRNRLAQAFGHVDRFHDGGFRQHDHKFFSADTADQIHFAQG